MIRAKSVLKLFLQTKFLYVGVMVCCVIGRHSRLVYMEEVRVDQSERGRRQSAVYVRVWVGAYTLMLGGQ